MTNIIPFPNSSNNQLQAIYGKQFEALHHMLEGDPNAQALLEQLNETTVEMFKHAQAAIDMITAMQVTTTRQRNDLIEELNHIERDLMNNTATHPLTQHWLEQMTERNRNEIMQRFVQAIADNLEIGDYDAQRWINILANQDQQLYLDDEAIRLQVEFMQYVGQRARAGASA